MNIIISFFQVDDSDKKPGRSSFIDDEDSKANISIDSGDKPISNKYNIYNLFYIDFFLDAFLFLFSPTLENLIQEKKNLHNYLKVYER